MAGTVIALNGPPRSGKDSIAHGLVDRLEIRGDYSRPMALLALAAPLRKACALLVGESRFADDPEFYSEMKDQPAIGSMTFRQLMIDVTENVVKKNGSRSHWAEAAWRSQIGSFLKSSGVVIITDLGFDEEQKFLYEQCINNDSEFLSVHLRREGCDFTHDSRNYSFAAGNVITVYNDTTIDNAVQQLIDCAAVFGVEF